MSKVLYLYRAVLLVGVILFTSSSHHLLFAQDFNSARAEFEFKFNDYDFNVVPAGEAGLIVFREQTKLNDNNDRNWEFFILDTDLEVQHEVIHSMEPGNELMGFEVYKNSFYLIFSVAKVSVRDWILLEIDLEKGLSKQYTVQNELEIGLSHFVISDRHLILGGVIEMMPTLIHYSMDDDKVQVLPGLYNDDMQIVDLRANENGTFNLLYLLKSNASGKQELNLKVFSADGYILTESTAEFPDNFRVHSGTTNRLKINDLTVFGTYGIKTNKLSQGIYYISFKPGSNNAVRFTEFSKMNEIFSYLGDRRVERIREKIDESDKANPYEFRTYLVIWDIKETVSNYYVFAEVIDPSFDTSIRPQQGPMGNPYYYRNRMNPYLPYSTEDAANNTGRYYVSDHTLVFSDLITSAQHESAHIIVFDKKGTLMDDIYGPLENNNDSFLEQLSAWNISRGKYHIFHKDQKEILYTNGDRYAKQKSDTTFQLEDIFNEDIARNDSDDGMIEYWYDNYFYIWGYQRLNAQTTGSRKKVFYINKIRVD